MPFFNIIQSNSFVGFNKKRSAGASGFGGKLFMWGINNSASLGLGDTANRSSPVQVGAQTDWSAVATGNHTLAVKNIGQLWSWGTNYAGQLGQNNTTARSSPVQVGALTDWATPSTNGAQFSSCIKTDGTLWSWGNNISGVLGLGDAAVRSSPVQVGSLTTWANISAGNATALATTEG
jgi:alpha-tubulin suppressor-like RCC1 family protein